MADPWLKSVRGRVGRWFANWFRTDPFDTSDFRPRIRFGPDSAVTSSPASWLAASQMRAMHPSYGLPDRESEYEHLRDEIARLAHPTDRPPHSAA